MKTENMIKCPQIRYHITYDESLALKDLEDLLYLIRVSNNDILQEMGISRAKGNDLQRVEKIQPGSIDIVTTINVVAASITIVDFLVKVGKRIKNKVKEAKEKKLEGTKNDKKVYYRNNLIIENAEQVNVINNTYEFNIHVDNIDDVKTLIEELKNRNN